MKKDRLPNNIVDKTTAETPTEQRIIIHIQNSESASKEQLPSRQKSLVRHQVDRSWRRSQI